MTLLNIGEMGIRLIILGLVTTGFVIWMYMVYRLSKIEAKLDRICEALGVEEEEEEEAYRHRVV